MGLRSTINIKITQLPTKAYPSRNKTLEFDFCESFAWKTSTKNMTDKGRIVTPKNLFYKDENGKSVPFEGDRSNIGGFNSSPLFLRGDKIELTAGYIYYDKRGAEITDTAKLIDGYISKVQNAVPIELEVEDNMWILKQVPLPNRTFDRDTTLESIMKWLIDYANKHDALKATSTTFTYKTLTETTFDQLVVLNETAAQLLNRLHRQYGFFSYFRGNELRCGSLRYVPNEANTEIFVMDGIKGNVCAEGKDLEYQRRDDIVLSAVAHNVVTETKTATTVDGTPKTAKKRLEVFVSLYNGVQTSKVLGSGERAPENTEGERREFFFPEAKTEQQLIDRAFKELEQYYYDGMKGSFKTWAVPFVQHGDNADVRSVLYPEQNGVYKIEAVEYSGSTTEGLRQQIFIDFKIGDNG